MFEGAFKNWKFVLKFLLFSFVFWLLQFSYHYYFVSGGLIELSFIRSFAFSGATFIGLSLLSSILFKFKPVLARHWDIRRSLGVTGFIFIIFHFFSVVILGFKGDASQIFFSLNPFNNLILFGLLAFLIFLIVFLSSNDFAVKKLGYKKWKAIQRLVYFAYWAAVTHFALINPSALMNLSGLLLILVTVLVLLGELYWFLKTASQKNFKSLGALIGAIIIVLYLISIYFGWPVYFQ